MPLRKGKSKKIVSRNIREMMHSEMFAAGKPRAKKHGMAVAAAMETKRRSGRAKKKKKGK